MTPATTEVTMRPTASWWLNNRNLEIDFVVGGRRDEGCSRGSIGLLENETSSSDSGRFRSIRWMRQKTTIPRGRR